MRESVGEQAPVTTEITQVALWQKLFAGVGSLVSAATLYQLARNDGFAADHTTAVSAALDAAEKKSGAARGAALVALAKQVDRYAGGAKDAARVRMMSSAIEQLAAASK